MNYEQNYKEKYEQALEKAKSMIDDLRKGEDILAVSDFESMFPELKESEDERIRKALIEYFSMGANNNETTCNIEDKKILAWLEKQGEHKPSEWSEEDERTIAESVEYLEKYAEYVQGGNSKLYVLGLADRLEDLRPQKQWKPSQEQKEALNEAILEAECSHNDSLKAMLKSLCNDLERL